MALTLEQVAKLAGVSRSTASRVINDRPGVRPEVRERVWQVIRRYGYDLIFAQIEAISIS